MKDAYDNEIPVEAAPISSLAEELDESGGLGQLLADAAQNLQDKLIAEIDAGQAAVQYFTFGSGQAFEGHFVRVIATELGEHTPESVARTAMTYFFGVRWCAQYDNPPEYGERLLATIRTTPHLNHSFTIEV